MKRILLTTLLTLFAAAAFAQTGAVTATVIDADTRESVVGAVVTVIPDKNPDKKLYVTSAYKGVVSLPQLAYGGYTLTVAFLGYNELSLAFTVDSARKNLGVLELKPGVQIETVVKEVKALRTSQRGDTVSYNAGAFKVTNDADVEGLLEKMPGITVTDGTVEAQGEEIKKVFVDGKEFFGEDVTTAIKSLPAQAVERIEVYNKLSDAAEFSGMDDGEGYKAINIVTRENCVRDSSASSMPDSATMPTPRPKTASSTSRAATSTSSTATAASRSSGSSTTSTSRTSPSRTSSACRATRADATAWASTWCGPRAAWRRSTPSA